jgi:predicted RNA-binding protein with PUA-like domain
VPAYWLLKTEPTEYSFDQLVKVKKALWDGVANPVALKHMRAAKKGDLVAVYHTGKERRAVGVAEVVAEAAEDKPFEVAARKVLAEPVYLEVIKAHKGFADSPLVKMGRLSVVPLSAAQWKTLLSLAKTKV